MDDLRYLYITRYFIIAVWDLGNRGVNVLTNDGNICGYIFHALKELLYCITTEIFSCNLSRQ